MEKFSLLSGLVAPLDRANVDTDQIIPKEHLKSIQRTGFASALFAAWRHDPEFVLNQPRYRGATSPLARQNSGRARPRAAAAEGLARQRQRRAQVTRPRRAEVRALCACLGEETPT